MRARGLLADGNMIDTAAKPSVGAWRRRVLAVLAIFLGTTVFFMMSSPSTPAELQLEAPWCACQIDMLQAAICLCLRSLARAHARLTFAQG